MNLINIPLFTSTMKLNYNQGNVIKNINYHFNFQVE